VTGRARLVGQVLAVGLVAGLLGLLGWRLVHDEGGEVRAALERGERPAAPAFSLPRLDRDGELSLASLRGKAVIVNFWASWCGPCKEEAPLLEAAWREHRDEGLVVVGVDFNDFRSDARRFAERNGMTYPLVYDSRATLEKPYGLEGVPETFFVDREGRLVGEPIVGGIDVRKEFRERFEAGIAAILSS
jgi:cytochrome c biogenesis protein CcmG, thiol:disulfide interchange protein DsbE